MDLSILVCSVHTRYDNFLLKIEKQLFDQYNTLSEEDRERVEIIVLTDNKTMMLGHKRNRMVDLAQGKYIVFVDDDDVVSDDYISQLLEATKSDADSIVFQAEVSVNGAAPKICYYSKDVKADYNSDTAYHRIPNHICCIKKEVSLKSSFPNVLYGEDAGYGKVLLPHLKTECMIDKVLYYYNYNSDTTETQSWRRNVSKQHKGNPIVDVIILSKAIHRHTQKMTQAAVDSCFYGSNGLPLNVIVVENGNRYEYRNATTIHKRDKFNYNHFANTAAETGSAEWIMVANNDLVFSDGWLHHLIAAGNDVVSPWEPNDKRQADITENTLGDTNGKHFSGWCFMIKRKLWEQIGGFDTDVDFYCSDDVVIEQVKALGVTPMIVKNSVVEHKVSQTFRGVSPQEYDNMTWKNVYIYNTKYNKELFKGNARYEDWVRRNT